MIELRNVTKHFHFGRVTAVRDVSLRVGAGEFVTLLGPSGCGKTTLLRLIAGFEQPSNGRIILDGCDVTDLPPYKRDVNQVFQSYALFPHLCVQDNIAFGLRMRRLPRLEIRRRVAEAIDLVELGGLEKRRPHELSGGQQQRVALARALVCRPKVLLLDEPMAALDAQLRRNMQIELKRLQQRLGITFVFVTHDQSEALLLSDRIAVMNAGAIEQFDQTTEIYTRPKTPFVARFIGQANVFQSQVVCRNNGSVRLRIGDGADLVVPADQVAASIDSVWVAIRSEKVRLHASAPSNGCQNVLEGTVQQVLFGGAVSQILVRTHQGLQIAATAADCPLGHGDAVWCELAPQDIIPLQQ